MPLNNEVPSYDSLLEFQEVYLEAVALSWKDEDFKKKLLDDAEQTLKNYFGYVCPWNVDLQVTEVKAGGPENYGWDAKTGTWDLPPNKISVGIPIQPENPEEVTIALATYNDAGPAYLFTCC